MAVGTNGGDSWSRFQSCADRLHVAMTNSPCSASFLDETTPTGALSRSESFCLFCFSLVDLVLFKLVFELSDTVYTSNPFPIES